MKRWLSIGMLALSCFTDNAPTTVWPLGPDLYLVHHALSDAVAPPPKPEPTNHVVVVDCSGSMWNDLPLIREQIKLKLPMLLAEDDTITLIWFSGAGQCGVLVETRTVSLADLADINRAVDRWLRPQGLTGFNEPLLLVRDVIARIEQRTKNEHPRISLFFMSDGCDNVTYPREEILRTMAILAPRLASTTLVEYGYYADHNLLVRMAEKVGGSVILASDFASYTPVFETALKGKRGSAKKRGVIAEQRPIGDFLFAIDGLDILTFGVDEISNSRADIPVGWGAAMPAHIRDVFYLSQTPTAATAGRLERFPPTKPFEINLSMPPSGKLDPAHEPLARALYAATSLWAQRIQPKLVWSLLAVLGDVRLIDEFSVCFGKQRYGVFVETTKAAAVTGEGRFVRGYDPKRAPKEDAFTILDLMDLLASDERCKILTASDAFVYSRIGRKAVDKGEMLTVTESKDVDALLDEMKSKVGERLVEPMTEILGKLDVILRNRKKALKFKLDAAGIESGYSILSLVWNEAMPNLSFRVKEPGSVDLSDVADLSAELRSVLPNVVRTYRYRTYTVVKDGLVHLDALPVSIPRAVFDTLVSCGAIDPTTEPWIESGDTLRGVIDVKKLPVINAKMIRDLSAQALAESAWTLLTLKAEAKVWKHYTPERTSEGFAKVYGAPAAKWLDEHGITDHSGFKVESTSAPPTDFYTARAFEIAIKGFSSLPSVKEVRERMDAKEPAKGKKKELTPSMKLMVPALCEIDAFLASPIYAKAADKDALFAKWVGDKAKATVSETRKLQTRMAMQSWAITVGGTWLFESFDETTLKLTLGGEARDVTFKLDESRRIDV